MAFPYQDILYLAPPAPPRPMARSLRAKIFAPFDALRGFDFSVSHKKVVYEKRRYPDGEELLHLNQELVRLEDQIRHTRCRPRIRVTYFQPCQDREHMDWQELGQYLEYTDTLLDVSAQTQSLVFAGRSIPFSDLLTIYPEVSHGGLLSGSAAGA